MDGKIKLEYTEGVVRSRKWKKGRQCNCQIKDGQKDKQ